MVIFQFCVYRLFLLLQSDEKINHCCFKDITQSNQSILNSISVKWSSLVCFPVVSFLLVAVLGIVFHVKWLEVQLIYRTHFQHGLNGGVNANTDIHGYRNTQCWHQKERLAGMQAQRFWLPDYGHLHRMWIHFKIVLPQLAGFSQKGIKYLRIVLNFILQRITLLNKMKTLYSNIFNLWWIHVYHFCSS